MIDAAGVRARAGAWTRRQLRAAEAVTVRKRSGHLYVWSRVGRAQWDRHRPPYRGPVREVSVAELPRLAPGAWYEELEPPAPAPVPPPGWVWPTAVGSAGRPMWKRTPKGNGVMEIPGGVVFGRRGHVGPDPHRVLVEACVLWREDRGQLQPVADRAVAAGVTDLPGVTMTLSVGPPNHAHSLLQSVPRLELLRRRFGLAADNYLLAAPPARATIDALARLGVAEDRIVTVPSAACAFRCDVLRYATAPYLADAGVGWSADFLHELFLPDPPRRTGRRLYVARADGARRRLLNEDDVLALLEPAGFEHVQMEERSVAEQAELFAAADVIVAPHGAALANIVFCRPGTLVAELIGRNTIGDLFPRLSWRRGLRHELIVGTEPAPPARWWTWQIDADTIADVAELRRRLVAHGVL